MNVLQLCQLAGIQGRGYQGSFSLRQEFLQEQLPRLPPDLDRESRSSKYRRQVVR